MRFLALCVLLLWTSCHLMDPCYGQEITLPDNLWNEVVSFARNQGSSNQVNLAELKEADNLYQVAKSMSKVKDKQDMSIQLFHILADHKDILHVPSQVALGHLYASDEHNKAAKKKALNYFVQAGENGPHQAALYNAGRIFVEQSEWVQGLAFVHAAATFGVEEESYSEKVAQNSRQAFVMLSNNLARVNLSTREVADIFLYANLVDFPASESKEISWWTQAMTRVDQTEQDSTLSQKDIIAALETGAKFMIELWETSSLQLSPLQAYLLLKQINGIFSRLLETESVYASAAAGYAEALALSPLCYEQISENPQEKTRGACFDQAIAFGIRLYTQVADSEGVQRLEHLYKKHPQAKGTLRQEL